MDLVNDLSSDLAIAVFVDRTLGGKLGGEDAKSFIALVEAELSRISDRVHANTSSDTRKTLATDVSH